jgi:cytochrome oxidase Cu insertion factor (SCO1/SenC/PrrC family)/mono/diheme cytochrome c family protein
MYITYARYAKRTTLRNFFVTLAVLLVCNVVLAHDGEKHGDDSKVATASSSSPWGKNYFPNTILITQDGEKVKFFDDLIKDKVVAINFIFTSCDDSCPLETARLRKVQEILGDRMGKDIYFYSISITPKTDTPPVLKKYMEKFNIGPGWTFLTGDEKEIITLRKKLGLYIEEIQNNKDNPDDHNLSLIIGNQATGRWMTRSPFENSYVLASQLGDWLHNWKSKKEMQDSYANAPKLRQFSPGETLFRTRCSSCHSFENDGVGPQLMGVVKQRDRTWLRRWLIEPDKMLAEKDPIATNLYKRYKIKMPNMRLTQKDVDDLIAYMEEEDARLSN